MDFQESSDVENIDNELKTLKEKRKKLESITSQLKDFQEKKAPVEEPTKELDNKTKDDKKSEFQENKLALTKQEILNFCDEVLEKWGNDPSKDSRHIFAMNAVKTSILWTEEDTLQEIWNEILQWNFELLYKNAIAQAKDENLVWSKIMGQLEKPSFVQKM